jgi:predicted enzyme related to lactoylglutathione lyase
MRCGRLTALRAALLRLEEAQTTRGILASQDILTLDHERRVQMQGAQLRYAIKFVADMDKAVKFYRDVVGLTLKFESPDWSEFVTGETTLALHRASDNNPAGKVELGFTVGDVEAFYREMSAKGVLFSMPPKKQDFGGVLAQFVDSEGAHCSVGAEAA